MRAWSRQLGFANNAPLSLMLAGKRHIPKKYIPNLISSLELAPDEGLYFETLVELERASGIREKSFYEERLQSLSPKKSVTFHEIESFKYLGNPLHMIILEMTDLQDFKADVEWIQNQLMIKATIQEIKDVLERLTTLKLLTQDSKGRWIKTQKHLTNRPDVADQGSREYHHNVSVLASEQVKIQDVLVREFNGYSINIKKGDVPKAKEAIREFIKNFATNIEAPPGTGDATYQLNVQFFGTTK